MSRRIALASLFALAVAACATPGSSPSSGRPFSHRLDASQQRGHDFAVRRCAGCHNVGLDDGGPSEGPPFRALARRYNPLSLERRFAQVSAHGFDSMPPVEFTNAEAEDLAAYVNSLTP